MTGGRRQNGNRNYPQMTQMDADEKYAECGNELERVLNGGLCSVTTGISDMKMLGL